jgi:acyl carrier protein
MESDSSCKVAPSHDRILGEVKQIVGEFSSIAPDEVRENHTLLGDLAWDSLDVVEFTMEIEEHFDVSVPDELVDRAKTVGDVADGVFMLLAQPQPDS